MNTITAKGYYLTTKQIARQQDCSERHARDILHEMEELVGSRYAPEDILEGSKMINMFALYDYLKYRKILRDPLLRDKAPEFDRQAWAECCPVVERWRI